MPSLPLPILAVLFFVVPLSVAVSLAYVVYRDAAARGSRYALAWGLASGLFGLVGLVYLFVREGIGTRTNPRTRRERIAFALFVASAVAMVLAATLAPPDPYTQGLYAVGTLLVTGPLSYVLVYRSGRFRGRESSE